MIRSQDQLRAILDAGHTVSMQAMFEGPGFRLADTETGETVFRSALNRLVKQEACAPIAFDMAGEPMQWGRPAT